MRKIKDGLLLAWLWGCVLISRVSATMAWDLATWGIKHLAKRVEREAK